MLPTDPADIGDQYVFIGIDANLKAIISYRVGKRDRIPPRKGTYFEPVPPHLARNNIIESTFDVHARDGIVDIAISKSATVPSEA